jgi:hypothetical protein
MYGAEHGFLLHALMVFASWFVFLAICAAPIGLIALAYWLGVRSGKRLDRRKSGNSNL